MIEERRKFNRGLERAFSLPHLFLDDEANYEKPEVKALLNLIENVPFLAEVADWKFDPELSKLIVQREAINLLIEKRKKEL